MSLNIPTLINTILENLQTRNHHYKSFQIILTMKIYKHKIIITKVSKSFSLSLACTNTNWLLPQIEKMTKYGERKIEKWLSVDV
jgi:hypothetical protein